MVRTYKSDAGKNSSVGVKQTAFQAIRFEQVTVVLTGETNDFAAELILPHANLHERLTVVQLYTHSAEAGGSMFLIE